MTRAASTIEDRKKAFAQYGESAIGRSADVTKAHTAARTLNGNTNSTPDTLPRVPVDVHSCNCKTASIERQQSADIDGPIVSQNVDGPALSDPAFALSRIDETDAGGLNVRIIGYGYSAAIGRRDCDIAAFKAGSCHVAQDGEFRTQCIGRYNQGASSELTIVSEDPDRSAFRNLARRAYARLCVDRNEVGHCQA